ncbi:hypothetical protein E1B28_008484 [Marasmius oreades]|uniref:Uncharacterized protein n=1 Tax=Marasmius oreades TaxID=181124 RepID=A0A9P7RZ31_9AGAR|nr:uncharacterized protein E1B28_008484 [Marasmius oreades]KAG7092108.1 hypothetical protein E1B28_008484 [Marasmius oreades]
MTGLKSQSMTEVTLTTVDGHALKRRRVDYPGLQRFMSEAVLNPQSTMTSAATLAPALSPSIRKSYSIAPPSPPSPKHLECIQTASALSLARRSPSPVPTELDIDNAERPDIDAHLYNTHKIKVIDYASDPPTTNFSLDNKTDFSTTSVETRSEGLPRIYEAFFAKDAMAQYEWFMFRGSREWDHLSQQGTEVWEDNDDKKEKTQKETELQQAQAGLQNSKSPVQTSPRRGQPLRRQQCVPLTRLKLFNDEPLHSESFVTPSSTPPTSSAKPAVSEQEKTPLLPSFSLHNPLAPRSTKPKRTYPIPGRLLYRLHEIRWVTDEEARQRWLTVDWEEFHAFEKQEREKYKDGKRGFMGKGEVGYPYWVVWGSPPSPQTSKKGKQKATIPELALQTTAEPETVELDIVAAEDIVESQNVHATLSGTLDTPRTSPEPRTNIETAGSPPAEESQSMHPTLSGSIKTPRNSPSPAPDDEPSTYPPTNTPLPTSIPNMNTTYVPSPKPTSSPKKTATTAALAAQLYYLALEEDAELGYGKPPSREYRRALGDRAGEVWIWLGEYSRRWGKFVGLGKKEKELVGDVNMNNAGGQIGDLVAGSDDNATGGSGRVLGMNAGGPGRSRTLGRTATLRDLGRAGTLDSTAFRDVPVSGQSLCLDK